MKPELPDVPASTGRVVMDFDGTLAEGVWPSPRIGKPMGKGIAILIYYASQGREVIVHTARPESHKERIFAWLRMAGLQDHVYDVVCGKPVADLYIDDKAWNPWVDTSIAESQHLCQCKEEGERAVSSGAPSQGSALSKAASPSPLTWEEREEKRQGVAFGPPEEDEYTNTGAVNG